MQDYVRLHGLGRADLPAGRHIAIAGDAELDEGNIYEALLEGWKHDVRNVWWIIDYNRQSLDSVVPDRLFGRIEGLFRDMGWNVRHPEIRPQAGGRLRARGRRSAAPLDRRLPEQPLLGADLPGRRRLAQRAAGRARPRPGLRAIIDPLSDDELGALMTNLGGHDIETLSRRFRAAGCRRRPADLLHRLHDQGHGAAVRRAQGQPCRADDQGADGGIPRGDAHPPRPRMGPASRGSTCPRPSCGPSSKRARSRPARRREGRALTAPLGRRCRSACPRPKLAGRKISTQAGFGDILAEIGRGQGELTELAEHIVTTSPDVTVSTNLGPWVNRRGVFDRHTRNDVFRDAKLASAQRWGMSPEGPAYRARHRRAEPVPAAVGAAGLAQALTGARLLPVGTVYDPFVNRGLDALIYACYQDARFLLVSTPSGLTLAPEGGQHQSINTPLIGMAQDRLASFEPAYVDELAILLRQAFEHMQKPDGSAVWLRLSTRAAGAAAAHARPGRGDRRRALGGPAGAGRAHRHRLSGAGGAGGRWPPSPNCAPRSRGPGCSRSPARTGCTPAGWRRAGARGRASARRRISRAAGAAGPRCGAGHGAGRPPGGACLAGRVRGQRVVPLGPTISARAGISPTCTGNTGWTWTRSWMPAPRRC